MTNTNSLLRVFFTFLVAYVFTGCAALRETLASSTEVPTLERQMIRVSVGMTIVRQNELMANKMPISADATWPKLIADGISSEQKKHLTKIINMDPYYATVYFTDIIQRDRLGFDASVKNQKDGVKIAALLLQQKISPLTYEAANKLDAMYGKDPKNWPNILNEDSSLDDFLEFKNGKLKDIESVNGDVYYSLGEAIIALLPISLQKDLDLARIEFKQSVEDVAELESQKGLIEQQKSSNKSYDTQHLSILKVELKNAQQISDEKEQIYFTLLDSAAKALESELDIDDENYVKLAYNINIVSKEIARGSRQAYLSFALALRKIQANNMFANFGNELESLAFAKLYVPRELQKKYNERVLRVGKNALYFLPNLFMGTYYAHKQSSLASKYEDISEIIIDAYETKYK